MSFIFIIFSSLIYRRLERFGARCRRSYNICHQFPHPTTYCCTTYQLTVTRHLFSYLLTLPTQTSPRVCVQGTQIGSTLSPHGSERRRDGQNQPLHPWRRDVLMQRRENGCPSSLALLYLPHFVFDIDDDCLTLQGEELWYISPTAEAVPNCSMWDRGGG